MVSSELENNSENQSAADLSRMINEMENILGERLVRAASNNRELCAQAEDFCVGAVRKALASRLHLLHLQYATTMTDLKKKAVIKLNQLAQGKPVIYEENTKNIFTLSYDELVKSFEKQDLLISIEVFEERLEKLIQFFANRFNHVSVSSADVLVFLSQADNQEVRAKLEKLFNDALEKALAKIKRKPSNSGQKEPEPPKQSIVWTNLGMQNKAAEPVHKDQTNKETRAPSKRFTIPQALLSDAMDKIGLKREQARDFILKLLKYLDANATNVILSILGPNHEVVIAKILDQYQNLHELIDSTDLAKLEPEQAMDFEKKLLALMQPSALP